jgi:hypothetical protein
MASTIQECENDMEFCKCCDHTLVSLLLIGSPDFIDAPLVLLPVDPKFNLATPAFMIQSLAVSPACTKPTRTPPYPAAPRGWFTIRYEGRNSMPGIERSLEFLIKILQENRFEVGALPGYFLTLLTQAL